MEKETNSILLVMPPANDEIMMPELGVPQLVGYIKKNGFSARQMDLNVVFNQYFFPKVLKSNEAAFIKTLLAIEERSKSLEALKNYIEKPSQIYNTFYKLSFIEKFKKNPAKIVGISIFDLKQFYPAIILAKIIKEIDPNVFVVVGGAWITAAETMLPEILNNIKYIDGAVPFAGEKPLLKLVQNCENKPTLIGTDLKNVPSLIWRDSDNEIQINKVGTRVPIRSIPIPDFEDLDVSIYPSNMLPIATSYGCYWDKCTFCRHSVKQSKIHERDPIQVVDFMEELSKRHGINSFFFAEHATRPAMMEAISIEILDRGLNVQWSALCRVEKEYTKVFCELIHKAGCRYLFAGLESASSVVLRAVKKGITIKQAENMLIACNHAGIGVNLFVLDLPTFSVDYFIETLDWLHEWRGYINDVIIQRFQLARNSAVYLDSDILGIGIPEEAHKSLDVFNLPYIVEGDAIPDKEFFGIVKQFRKEFAEGRDQDMDERMLWVACGESV